MSESPLSLARWVCELDPDIKIVGLDRPLETLELLMRQRRVLAEEVMRLSEKEERCT